MGNVMAVKKYAGVCFVYANGDIFLSLPDFFKKIGVKQEKYIDIVFDLKGEEVSEADKYFDSIMYLNEGCERKIEYFEINNERIMFINTALADVLFRVIDSKLPTRNSARLNKLFVELFECDDILKVRFRQAVRIYEQTTNRGMLDYIIKEYGNKLNKLNLKYDFGNKGTTMQNLVDNSKVVPREAKKTNIKAKEGDIDLESAATDIYSGNTSNSNPLVEKLTAEILRLKKFNRFLTRRCILLLKEKEGMRAYLDSLAKEIGERFHIGTSKAYEEIYSVLKDKYSMLKDKYSMRGMDTNTVLHNSKFLVESIEIAMNILGKEVIE